MSITLAIPCRHVENKHSAVLNECELSWGRATCKTLCAADSSVL